MTPSLLRVRSAKSLTRAPTQHYIALAYWALVEYFYYLLPDDSSFSCRVVFTIVAPLFKPFSPAMWMALMATSGFARHE